MLPSRYDGVRNVIMRGECRRIVFSLHLPRFEVMRDYLQPPISKEFLITADESQHVVHNRPSLFLPFCLVFHGVLRSLGWCGYSRVTRMETLGLPDHRRDIHLPRILVSGPKVSVVDAFHLHFLSSGQSSR